MSFKTIASLVGAIVLLLLLYWGWTELKVWWKTREMKAVNAATQQLQQELEANKAVTEKALADAKVRDDQVKALTQQIKSIAAAADRDRQARVRLEQQAAAREPELQRLRAIVTKLEVERRALVPVSTVHEAVLELRKRGY